MRENILWGLVVAAVSICGAAGAVYPGLTPLALGLVALVLLIRWPTAFVVVALILCQEISPLYGYGLSAPMQTIGNQFYFTLIGKVPLLEIVLLVATIAALAHAKHRARIKGLTFISLAGLLVSAVCFIQGVAVATTIGQYARPFILAACGLAVASTTAWQPGGWKAVFKAAVVALSLEAVLGIALVATGAAARSADGSLNVFYDSSLPALAAAILLAATLTDSRRRLMLVAVLGGVVLMSGRRNVWLAAVIALVVTVAFRKGRARNLIRISAVCAVLLGVAYFAFPTLITSAWDHLLASNALSTSGDQSSMGHLDDISVGWMYAQQAPILGYGADRGPLPGLFVQEGQLYVHNEILLNWLRYGILGAAAVGTLMVMGVAASLRALRAGASGIRAAGALFLLIAPLCAITAPFYSTTQRWPALLGLAAGALLAPTFQPVVAQTIPTHTEDVRPVVHT